MKYLYNTLLLSTILLVIAATTIIFASTTPNAISLDRVTLLLPSPTCTNYHTPVSHPLNARGGSGCFLWGTPHTHLIKVIPSQDPAHQCTMTTKHGASVRGTTQAIVIVLPIDSSVVSNSKSSRQNAVVWVEDIQEASRAVCEVYLDTIQSIFIKTSTKRINLGDREVFSIQGYDEHQDVFSSLEGLNFQWFFLTDAANNNMNFLSVGPSNEKITSKIIAKPISFIDANVDISPIRSEMAKKDMGTDLLFISGTNSGRTKFKASYICGKGPNVGVPITTTVDIVVSEPLDVLPPILRICPHSEFSFFLQSRYSKSPITGEIIASSSKPTLISLPQPHLVWRSDSDVLSVIDDKLAKVRALTPGHAKVSVIDTTLQETSASSTVIIVAPVMAKVLLYYYDDTDLSTTRPIRTNLPLPSTSHSNYIQSYSKVHHGQSTLTTIPIEIPFDTFPAQPGKKNQTMIQLQHQIRSSFPLTGNISSDDIDTLITPSSPTAIEKRAHLQLQPTCDGSYHLSPESSYIGRLLILDNVKKPIDICQGITIKIVYTSIPKPKQDVIDLSLDSYGFFTLSTPKYDSTINNNKPITGIITVSIDSFVQDIKFQIDPPLHVQTDFDSHVASSIGPLDNIKTLLFPSMSTSCPTTFIPIGGSGKFYWANASLKSTQSYKGDFLTINSSTISQLQLSPTKLTGITTISLLDSCNPLSRASFRVETAPIGDLCLLPHTNELFLPPTFTALALPSTTANNQNIATKPTPDPAMVYYYITDNTGRKFSDTHCIQVQTQFKQTTFPTSQNNNNNNPNLILPHGKAEKIALNAVYQQNCTPQLDAHNQLASPQPQLSLTNASNQQIQSTSCYTQSFKPLSAGFITLSTSINDAMYTSLQSSTTFAIYHTPHLFPFLSINQKNINDDTIHAVFNSPIQMRIHNGPFPFPALSNQSAMCGKVKHTDFKALPGAMPQFQFSSPSTDLKIIPTINYYSQDIFPVFNLTCSSPTQLQLQKAKNNIISHDMTFVAFNQPILANQYPHQTTTTARVQCYEPVCPANRHVKVVLSETIDIAFKTHPLQNSFKYTALDPTIATIVSESNNLIQVKGIQVGMTIIIVDVILQNEIQPHMRSFVIVQVETADVSIIGNNYLIAGENGSYTLHSSSKSSSEDLQYMSVTWSMMNTHRDANVMLESTFSYDQLETTSSSSSSFPIIKKHNVNGLSTRLLTTDSVKPGKYQLMASFSTTYPVLSPSTQNFLRTELSVFHNVHLCAQLLQQYLVNFISQDDLQNDNYTSPYKVISTRSFDITVVSKLQLQSPNLIRIPFGSYYPIQTTWSNDNKENSSNKVLYKTYNNKLQISNAGLITAPNEPISSLIHISTPGQELSSDLAMTVHVSKPHSIDLLPVVDTMIGGDPSIAVQSLLYNNKHTQSTGKAHYGLHSLHNSPLCPIDKNATEQAYSLVLRDGAGYIFSTYALNDIQTTSISSDKKKNTTTNQVRITIDKPELLRVTPTSINPSFGILLNDQNLPLISTPKQTTSLLTLSFTPLKLPQTPQEVTISFQIQSDVWGNNGSLQSFYIRLTIGSQSLCTPTPITSSNIPQDNNSLPNQLMTTRYDYSRGLRLTMQLSESFLSLHQQLPSTQSFFGTSKTSATLSTKNSQDILYTIHKSLYGLLINATNDAIKHHSLTIFDKIDVDKFEKGPGKSTTTSIPFVLPQIHLYIKHVDLALGIVLADAFFIPQCMIDTQSNTDAHNILHPHQWQECEQYRIARSTDPLNSNNNVPHILPSHAYAIELAHYFEQIQSLIFDHIEQRQLPLQSSSITHPNSTINLYNPWVKHILSNADNNNLSNNNLNDVFAQNKPIYIDLFDATPIKQLLLAQHFYFTPSLPLFPKLLSVFIHSSPIITTLQASPISPKNLVTSEIKIDPNQPFSTIGSVPKTNSNTSSNQYGVTKDDLLQYRYTIKIVPDIIESYTTQLFSLIKRVEKNTNSSNNNPLIQHLYPFYSPYTHLSTQITQSDYILSCLATYSHHTIPTLIQQLLSYAQQLPALQQSQQHINIPPHILKNIPIDTTFFPTVFYSQSQPYSTSINTFMLPSTPHSTIRGTCLNIIAGLTTSYATPASSSLSISQQHSLWAISQHYILILSQRIEHYYNTPIYTPTELPQQHQPIANQGKNHQDTEQQRPVLKHATAPPQPTAESESSNTFSIIIFASTVALIAGGLIIWSNVSKQSAFVPPPPQPSQQTAPSMASPRPQVPRQSHIQTPHTKLYYSYGEN